MMKIVVPIIHRDEEHGLGIDAFTVSMHSPLSSTGTVFGFPERYLRPSFLSDFKASDCMLFPVLIAILPSKPSDTPRAQLPLLEMSDILVMNSLHNHCCDLPKICTEYRSSKTSD